MVDAPSIVCPHCRRPVAPSGEIDFLGQLLSVYQCEHCVRDWHFDGATFETAFTFALTADGALLDPESGAAITPQSLDQLRGSAN